MPDPLYPEPGTDDRLRDAGMFGFGSWRADGHSAALTIADLVASGAVSERQYHLLAMLAARQTSVAVIAAAASAGKTTLLNAYLAMMPAGVRRIDLRGQYETFAWQSDGWIVPECTVVVAGEISAHLPVYLWGPPVARFAALHRRGFALATTAHADDPAEWLRLLTGYPLAVPPVDAAAFRVVLRLGPRPAPRPGGWPFHLADGWVMAASDRGGLVLTQLIADGEIDEAVAGALLREDAPAAT